MTCPGRRNLPALVIAAMMLVASAVLLLARLGHYPLWDDEAITALAAEGVLRTGDTSAVVDHNVVAYGGGILLSGLHDRSTPPLPAYVVAASMALLGHTALAARLPFALLGLACVALILRWLWRDRATRVTNALVAAALLGNVSFFLYFRNARYYGVAIFCSVAIVYLYLHWTGRRRTLVGMAALSLLLLASNYLNFVALYACLGLDYLVWRRQQRDERGPARRLTVSDWLILLGPQVVVGLVVVSIWNPLATPNSGAFWANGLGGKAVVFWRSLRDLSANEYGPVPLLLLAPLLWFRFRDPWLLRAPAALLAYLLVMALLAPTPIARSRYADVRYLAPLIPLCIAITVRILAHAWTVSRPAAVVLAGLALFTNVLHLGVFRAEGSRVTLVQYARELLSPPPDPYSAAIAWVRRQVRDGQTIAVLPNHMTYPLMFHAPGPTYAWQFPPDRRADEQFARLPAVQFRYEGTPDYILVFGPTVTQVLGGGILQARPGVRYEPFDRLERYWQDRYRPELMFRSFTGVTNYDPRTQDIYVLKAVPAATPPDNSSTAPALAPR